VRKLVLFDIDGTLLSTEGAAARAFLDALDEVFGTAGPVGEVSFAGKTDPRIAHDLMSLAGLDRDEIERGLPELWKRYIGNLDRELLRTPVRVYPGVEACVELVERRSETAVLGLLTGNIEAGAQRKLDASGIGFARFRTGVFGSDSDDRNVLPALAAKRAEERTGIRYEGSDVVVVGDTPADIACGDAFGARTVAVATGTFSREELAARNPDFLFDSLERAEEVWDAIVG
jgi:phosphoglycolate phosphatase-like HAD superfamily hydrolase